MAVKANLLPMYCPSDEEIEKHLMLYEGSLYHDLMYVDPEALMSFYVLAGFKNNIDHDLGPDFGGFFNNACKYYGVDTGMQWMIMTKTREWLEGTYHAAIDEHMEMSRGIHDPDCACPKCEAEAMEEQMYVGPPIQRPELPTMKWMYDNWCDQQLKFGSINPPFEDLTEEDIEDWVMDTRPLVSQDNVCDYWDHMPLPF